jgi:Tol biopolymer transport system component
MPLRIGRFCRFLLKGSLRFCAIVVRVWDGSAMGPWRQCPLREGPSARSQNPCKNLAIVQWSGRRCSLQYPIGKTIYSVTGGRWLSDVRISPRRDALAFLEHPLEGDDAGYVQLVDLKGQKRVLSGFWLSVRGMAWDRSADALWFSASDSAGERELPRAVYQLSLSGKLRRVVSESGDLTFHDLSPDGAMLISRDVERYEILANIAGVMRDLSWLNFSRADDLSHDGQVLVITVEGEAASRDYEVYVRKTDGSPPVKLGVGYGSAISPDRQWVLAVAPFGSGPDAVPQIVLWPVGKGTRKVLSQESIAQYTGGWFPDGKRIFFAGSKPGHSVQTWMQDLNGGPPQAITPEGVRGTLVSPDGKLMTAVDDAGTVWLYPLGGGSGEKLHNIGAQEIPIAWSSSGRELYLADSDYLPAKVYRLDRFTGRHELVRELAPSDSAGVIPDISSVFASADGRTMVYSYFRMQSDLYTATSK